MADAARLLELADKVESCVPHWHMDDDIAQTALGLPPCGTAGPRPYTTSIDAAVALVPEHFSWNAYAHPKIIGIEDEPRAYADVYRLAPDLTTTGTVLTRKLLSGPHEAEAPTAAAALCAAALRARAAMMEKSDG